MASQDAAVGWRRLAATAMCMQQQGPGRHATTPQQQGSEEQP